MPFLNVIDEPADLLTVRVGLDKVTGGAGVSGEVVDIVAVVNGGGRSRS